LLAVAPHGRGSQAQHVARVDGLEHCLEGIRSDVVTFIDNDVTITAQ
jgi:hypothetical protein